MAPLKTFGQTKVNNPLLTKIGCARPQQSAQSKIEQARDIFQDKSSKTTDPIVRLVFSRVGFAMPRILYWATTQAGSKYLSAGPS